MLTMRYVALALAGSIVLGACSTATQQPPTRLPVVATIYPLAFLAQEIGGDNVSVRQSTPNGVEPHDFEPSPQDVQTAHDATLFLMNGVGVDSWADDLKEDLAREGVMVMEAASTLPLLEGGKEESEEEEGSGTGATEAIDEERRTFDPHVWLDPVLYRSIAETMRDALIAVDPAHAQEYRDNANALLVRLQKLHMDVQNGLRTCGLSDIIVSHDAFRYLANRYGFTTIAISGLSPEEEPSPRTMADIANVAKEKDIRHIFFETLASPKLSETIAQEIGAETLMLNPIEGLTPEDEATGKTYVSLMENNLQALRTALRCQ